MVGALEPFMQNGHAAIDLFEPVVLAIHKAQLHNAGPVVWVLNINEAAPRDKVRHVVQITKVGHSQLLSYFPGCTMLNRTIATLAQWRIPALCPPEE
jgi:hypothetical protein